MRGCTNEWGDPGDGEGQGHFADGREDWLDRATETLAALDTTVTVCVAPDQQGIAPHCTGPPRDPLYFRRFLRADNRTLCAGPGQG
jgi:hypothetical protein